MARITHGAEILFGVITPLPLKGFPKGRTRIRMRNNDIVKIWVRTEDGIEMWAPTEHDGYWKPKFKIGVNKTARE